MDSAETRINAAVTAAVVGAVADPGTAANMSAVGPIVEAVAPILVNAANAEPKIRSRVIIGAVVSITMPILGLVGIATDVINADELTAIVTALFTIAGGAYTLYGRLTTKPPIGQ